MQDFSTDEAEQRLANYFQDVQRAEVRHAHLKSQLEVSSADLKAARSSISEREAELSQCRVALSTKERELERAEESAAMYKRTYEDAMGDMKKLRVALNASQAAKEEQQQKYTDDLLQRSRAWREILKANGNNGMAFFEQVESLVDRLEAVVQEQHKQGQVQNQDHRQQEQQQEESCDRQDVLIPKSPVSEEQDAQMSVESSPATEDISTSQKAAKESAADVEMTEQARTNAAFEDLQAEFNVVNAHSTMVTQSLQELSQASCPKCSHPLEETVLQTCQNVEAAAHAGSQGSDVAE